MSRPVILIHGGAGALDRAQMTLDLERTYRSALASVLRQAGHWLEQGRTSLDVVEFAVALLEDNPLFNAGHGAVFTSAGDHELEASIMDGRTGLAGAACGLRHIAHPVQLARLVMERSGHVLLAGPGAEAFAVAQGVALVDNCRFSTEFRYRQLERDRKFHDKLRTTLSEDANHLPSITREGLGTVGAVALDAAGNLAAATSTGGMSNKRPGRVGDSPLIGLGCYANNATCAVSATGQGEFIIRQALAYDISARIEYLGASVTEAARVAVMERLSAAGGRGGVIALSRSGESAMTFNSAGMYRGRFEAGGEAQTAIYGAGSG